MHEHPPINYHALQLWKVYVECSGLDVWSIVWRWTKEHGNPFEEVLGEDYVAHDLRQLHREALEYLIKNRTR